MKRSMRWVCATVAPWALATGIVLSFTAAASIDPKAGYGRAPDYAAERLLDTPLVPALARLAGASPAGSRPRAAFGEDPDATPPRFVAKGGAFPRVVRQGKGGGEALRPSFSRRGAELARARIDVADRLAFAQDSRVLPPTILMRGPLDGPDWDAARGLEPWTGEDPTTTAGASSVQSPAAASAGSTGAARAPAGRGGDGATPTTPRASALASSTPAPADGAPVQVAAAPVSLPTRIGGTLALPAAPTPAARPSYASLFAGESGEREQRCLAEAVYFEARSEPEEGRAAVAQVVLNRARSGLYPPTVCGVVYQNRHRHLACQFTFACEGKALRVTEPDAWEAARRIARDVSEGRTWLADVGGATHYHADYVSPYWARKLRKMDVIGRHIFYQLRPGQT